MISKNVVILTRAEFDEIKRKEFLRGVERGRFEERCPPNSPPPGCVGHSGATESTGAASKDVAVRPANSDPSRKVLEQKFAAFSESWRDRRG